MARRPGGKRRRKVCYFTSNHITHIDYKDVELLKRFISERGKILPRRDWYFSEIPTSTYNRNQTRTSNGFNPIRG